MSKYHYIYGPVASWRLGRSLGVDLLAGDTKACTFDCVYCQLGSTPAGTHERQVFVPTAAVMEELAQVRDVAIDYITFSGMGEPTLAANLGEVLAAIKESRQEKRAVLTNASLLYRDDVREELCLADFVSCKLDAPSPNVLARVDRPVEAVTFEKIIEGIAAFRKECTGTLALQMMFVEENKHAAADMASCARELQADEIHLNTPLRTCAVTPLSRETMKEIEQHFSGLNVVNVYDRKDAISVKPLDEDNTERRRPQ